MATPEPSGLSAFLTCNIRTGESASEQERGEVQRLGGPGAGVVDGNAKPTAADIGLRGGVTCNPVTGENASEQAHDDVIAAAYRLQGDALAIQSRAKMRLADEYDAAQERGEVARLVD